MPDPEFVSERILPLPGAFAAGPMGRGEPGLPPGFLWRDREYRVVAPLATGKKLSPSVGEMYVRRHTFRLRMDDGSIWSVYALRQPPHGWFLKTRTPG